MDTDRIDGIGMESFKAWKLEDVFDGSDNFLKRITNESYTIPIIAVVVYVTTVFGIKSFMKDRPRFVLRNYLFVWSSILAIFSIIGTYRTCIILIRMYNYGGIKSVVCNSYNYTGPITQFWAIVFVLSKFVEFGDTIFIVLRKQKLIFLHWYHHVTVMLYGWLNYRDFFAGGLVFMPMNFFVHAFMYTYYAIRAYGIKLPKYINILITTLQIAQMFVGCFTICAIYSWQDPVHCHTSQHHLTTGFLMYGSYLILFSHFFYTTYIRTPTTATESSKNLQGKSQVESQTSTRHGSGETRLRKRQS